MSRTRIICPTHNEFLIHCSCEHPAVSYSKLKPKGVILAGGTGSRLYPLTKGISKQLLPVYKYPMIYFPINTLKQMGIKEILIITTSEHLSIFQKMLEHVTSVNLSYAVQNEPNGLPEAFIIAEEWLDGSDVALILGDNVFINEKPLNFETNKIFSFGVKSPERYGVVEYEFGKIKNIVEKPVNFISDQAVVGLYCFKNYACGLAKTLKPGKRKETEIVDLIKLINDKYDLTVEELDGFWFDCGVHDDLLDCANLVKSIEHRTNKNFDVY